MAGSNSESTACVVCCHDTEVWAVGECNHPTCLRCCARLRMLCDKIDCPVCRMSLKQIAVVSVVKPYQKIAFQHWPYYTKKYEMYFPTNGLFSVFRKITDNACQLCPHLPAFKTFGKLQDHVFRAHQLQFCEICVENLRLFPAEFKMYTRSKLAAHRRNGDVEDSSYKGHPYCQFCDDRYLDNDALHLHLRKKHFWCHFCEADGRQDFYLDFNHLRSHFKKDHHLCEEGECYTDVLSAAFRNEIDLKAHLASAHSKGLSKAAVKNLRQLPVEFFVNSTPVEEEFAASTNRRRALPIRSGNGGGHVREAYRSAQQAREKQERELAAALSASLQETKRTELKEKDKKASRPPPGRKKAVCAQREAEPPPGFRKNVVGEMNTSGQPATSRGRDIASEDAIVGKPVEKDGAGGVEGKEQNWPSLKARGDHKHHRDIKDAVEEVADPSPPPPGYAKKTSPNLSTRPSKNPAKLVASSRISPPPIAPPPGLIRPNEPPSSESTVHVRSIKVPNAKAFPLPSTNLTVDEPAKNNSGGSKIFEDIRQALNYDDVKVKEFQNLSGWFRNGGVSVEDYHRQCKEMFGPRCSEIGLLIAKVMPREKREELRALFGVWRSGPTKQKTKRNKLNGKKSPPSAWMGQPEGSGSSEGKQQPVARSSHLASEEDYPSLSAASKLPQPKPSAYQNAWNVAVT